MPKSLVASVMGRLFCRNYDYPQSFHASVGKIQFSRFRFLLEMSAYYFQLFIFHFYNFELNNQISAFQISVGRFQFSRFYFSSFCFSHFSFSSVNCQIPTFRLLLAIPIFTLLLCKFPASYKLHFKIGITCVISAQLATNT